MHAIAACGHPAFGLTLECALHGKFARWVLAARATKKQANKLQYS